ncbi:MAG: carboxypeptidase-like regulatory domain-containing protein [Cyclobacteriaceae bacterium]
MKKIILIFLAQLFFGLIVAQTPAEVKITREFVDAPLHEVIKYLEQVSGQQFSYSSSTIPLKQAITISFNNISLTQALEKLSEVVPLTYKLISGKVVLMYNPLKQTIRGSIRDQTTQSPIIGATVAVLDLQPILGAATDVDGNFTIENVPLGRRNLKVSFIGYEDKLLSGILLGSGKELVLEIEMVESVIQMQELIVTDQNIANLPVNEMAAVSAMSFTVEETKRFPVGLGDPLRLASSFAGVVSSDDINNEIVIRGNTPRGILWKLDGVEIPGPNHFSNEGAASGGISMFSTQVISRSDFFTGAFAPEYGNATAGVFDIHLRKGNNQKQENTTQIGLLGVDVSSEGPFQEGKRSSYLFNYRYSTLAILDKIGLVIQDENETNVFQDLSFKLNFPTRAIGNFSLFGLGGLSSFKNIEPGLNDQEDYNMGVLGFSNQVNLSESSFLKTTLSYSGTSIVDDLIEIFDRPVSNVNKLTKSYTRASVLLNKKFNARHLLETGATYSLLSYSFSSQFNDPANPPPYDSYRLFDEEGDSGSEQAFVSWKYRVSPKISLVNGVHWLRFDLTGESSLEPRSSIKWQLGSDKSLSFAYGLHSRIESLQYYLGNFIAADGTKTQYNTNLGLTKSQHFVTGFEKTFRNNAYFKTEVYFQDLFNVPVLPDSVQSIFSTLNISDGFTTYPLINSGSGRNYGIEFTVEKKFFRGSYYLMNLSLYQSKYKVQDGVERDTKYNGNYAFNALWGKEFAVGKNGSNSLGFSSKFSYAGNKRYTPINLVASNQQGREVRPVADAWSTKYPAHIRFDIQVSYRRNKRKTTSEWRLDLQNMGNRKNILYDYYSSQARAIFQETQIGLVPVLSYRLEF